MKTRIYLALILGLALILPVLAVEDDWGNTSEYQEFFDRGSIVTIQGKVTGINRDTVPLPGMEPGFFCQSFACRSSGPSTNSKVYSSSLAVEHRSYEPGVAGSIPA